jgi:integrase
MAKARRGDNVSAARQRTRKGEGYMESTGLYYSHYYDETGKRKTITSKTLEGLREKKNEIDNLLANQVKVSAKGFTLDHVYAEWLTRKRGLVGHTKANYMWVYEHYCQGKKLGKMKVQDITKGKIRDHYNQLREQQHLAVTTIDGLQTVVMQVLSYAVEEDYIRANPAIGAMTEMKRSAKPKQAHPALTKAEQDRFLSFIESHEVYAHWYPMFKIFVGSGLRVGELTGLRWEDIDLEAGTINVNHTLLYYSDKEYGGCRFLVGKPKTKAGYRTVVMINGLKEAFELQRKYLDDNKLRCAVAIEGTHDVPEDFYTDFIFLSKDGGCLHQGTVNKAIKRIIRDANVEAMDKEGTTMLPPFSCHTFRSTYITRAAEKGVPIDVTMKQCGHMDRRTTEQIYTTVSPDWQKREMSAMADLFD